MFAGGGEELMIGKAAIESRVWENILDPCFSRLSPFIVVHILLYLRITSEKASECSK